MALPGRDMGFFKEPAAPSLGSGTSMAAKKSEGSVGQGNYERDTGSHFSIVPLLFLYCFSIVSLLLSVFVASTPGDSPQLIRVPSRLVLDDPALAAIQIDLPFRFTCPLFWLAGIYKWMTMRTTMGDWQLLGAYA
jgi:hypothetical protein